MQLYSQPPRQNQPQLIPQDVPVYRVKEGQFYADDELFPEGSIVAFSEEPNLELEPINDLAMTAMREYLAKLDDLGRKVAEKAGKAYVSYTDAFNNAHSLAKEEGRKVSLLNGAQSVPLMGGKKRGGRPKAVKIDVVPAKAEGQVKVIGRDEVNGKA